MYTFARQFDEILVTKLGVCVCVCGCGYVSLEFLDFCFGCFDFFLNMATHTSERLTSIL